MFDRHVRYSLLGDDPKLKIDRFPDGQSDVEILNEKELKNAKSVHIVARINNWMQLEVLYRLRKKISALSGSAEVTAYIPYLLGARSDRPFNNPGTSSYLKDFEHMLLNNCSLSEVIVLDAHNPTVLNARFSNISLEDLHCLDTPSEYLKKLHEEYAEKRIYILAPDKGAKKRAQAMLESLSQLSVTKSASLFGLPALEKERVGPEIKIKTLNDYSKVSPEDLVLIVDDICDGGGTFIQASKALREAGLKSKLGLWVTHGIFSKGVSVLQPHFDFVVTTNSYQDIGGLEQGSIKDKDISKFLTQINVF